MHGSLVQSSEERFARQVNAYSFVDSNIGLQLDSALDQRFQHAQRFRQYAKLTHHEPAFFITCKRCRASSSGKGDTLSKAAKGFCCV